MAYRRWPDGPRTLLKLRYDGRSFVPVSAAQLEPGPLPLHFARDNRAPRPHFLYELLAEGGQPIYTVRTPDPTGLFIEAPRKEGDSVRLGYERARRDYFLLLIPDLPAARQLRITSRRLEKLGHDGPVTIDLTAFDLSRFTVKLPNDLAVQRVGDWLTWSRPMLKIVLCGDGYTDSGDFNTDADKFVARLNSFVWLTSQVSLSIIRIFEASQETGATIAGHCLPTGVQVTKDTVYSAAYGFSTTANCDVLAGEPEIPETHMWNLGADCVVVLVNSDRYGGAGDGLTAWYAAKNAQAMDLAVHELGHCLYLSDEYGEGWPGYNAVPDGPNVTDTPDTPPWASLINVTPWIFENPACNTPTPGYLDPSSASTGTIGAFRGANYDQCDWYRSAMNCEMRHPNDEFCIVCRRAIVAEVRSRP